jgi:PAS domain S-box-containing protein
MKILIVDDNEDSRIILKKNLEYAGHAVETATNGAEALKMAKKSPPDMIISDGLMPVMDGFKLCREVKKDEQLRKIPFIFYTATYMDQKDKKLALYLGASRYILKPVETDEFIQIINEVFQEYEEKKLPVPEKPLAEEYELFRMYEDSIARKLQEKVQELQLYREIFTNSKDAVAILDPKGFYIGQNPSYMSLLGYSDKELRGKTPAIHLGDEAFSNIVKELSEKRVYRGELTSQTKSGTKLNIELSAFPILDDKGEVVCYVGINRDITERKQAEELIQRQLSRMTALRDIDMAINSSLNLKVILHILLDQVITQLRVDAADVLLLNPHTQVLEYAAGRGFKTTATASFFNLRLGDGYAGRIALERKACIVPDLSEAAEELTRTQLVTEEGFIAYCGIPLIAKGQVKGVLETFHRTLFKFNTECLNFMELLAGQAAIAIDNAALFDELQRSNIELTMAYDTTLEGWSRALDYRDKETEGHSQRVTEMTLQVAKALGISEKESVHVRRGALLHDIGKLGVPDSILLKPGKLTPEEWKIMCRHPEIAYELLSPISFLRPALDIPYCHHEKWDGTGYPRGLKGEQIPLAARIFAVVDVWDALRSKRPYRPAWPEEKVREYIRSLAGTHFDPKVVEVFLKLISGNKP